MSRRYFQKRERKLLLMTASNKQNKDGDPVSRLLLIQNAIDQKLSAFAVSVLGRLLTHYNHKTGRCDPSEKTLAEHFDVSEKKVWRAIKELKDTKFIFVEHRYKANNLYRFNWSKAVKIDLKKTHSGRTPVSYQSDILDGQNRHSGRTKSALWTDKIEHSGRTPVSDKLSEGNSVKELSEGNTLRVSEKEEFQADNATKTPSHTNKRFSSQEAKSSSLPPQTDFSLTSEVPQSDAADRQAADVPSDQSFNRFWDAFPKKVSKEATRSVFDRKIADGIDTELMIVGAVNYAVAVRGKEQRWIKQPENWLREERWTDDYATTGDANEYKKILEETLSATAPRPQDQTEQEAIQRYNLEVIQQHLEASQRHYRNMMGEA